MDKIILNGCRFYGYHGAFTEEQTLGQRKFPTVRLSILQKYKVEQLVVHSELIISFYEI